MCDSTSRRRPGRRLQLSDVLSAASGRSDWQLFRALWRQYRRLVPQQPDAALLWELRAGLAGALAAKECGYAAVPAELAVHLWAQAADVEGRERLDAVTFEAMYRGPRFGSEVVAGRRRPSLLEAAVETCRRWRDSASVADAMAGTGTSGIVCGSVNYGPFYSVRGNVGTDMASDLDLVVVTTGDTDLVDLGKRLGTVPGIRGADAAEFEDRAKIFGRDLDDGRTTFSHKFGLWAEDEPDPLLFGSSVPGGYLLSVHVVPPEVLAFALVESSRSLIAETAGGRRSIWDYRNRASERADLLHGFDGRRFRFVPEWRTVASGTLRRTSAYYIDDAEHYYPGFYQTITQPRVNLRWDDARVGHRFDQLRHKLAERLRFERQRDPFTDMRPSFAHLRRGMLAPHVIQLLDEAYSPS